MNFYLLFRLLFFPVLFPLSFAYGIIAFCIRLCSSRNRYKSSNPVVSIGNFVVGGSGKTPIVIETAKALKSFGLKPVVVSKSYKGNLKSPKLVCLDSDPMSVGDEAFVIKNALDDVDVVSGPKKSDSVLFYDQKQSSCVYIVDDGAQHHKLQKDINVHVWDMTRGFLDHFPFPLGLSREFWFLVRKPELSVLNRCRGDRIIQKFIKGKTLKANYKIKSVLNDKGVEPQGHFTLISGIGNFVQLKDSVSDYFGRQDFNVIEGVDHDDFSWFQADPQMDYVCTQKDKFKLDGKILKNKLYVVKSEFDEAFKKEFSVFLKNQLGVR